jgi:hypothetical protein
MSRHRVLESIVAPEEVAEAKRYAAQCTHSP